MAEPTIVIKLTADERLTLEQIILDHDEQGALEFLRDCVLRQIERAESQHCGPMKGASSAAGEVAEA